MEWGSCSRSWALPRPIGPAALVSPPEREDAQAAGPPSNRFARTAQLAMRSSGEGEFMRATPDFDFQLGESAEMIREAAGRFADEQIAPLAAQADREDWFPRSEERSVESVCQNV